MPRSAFLVLVFFGSVLFGGCADDSSGQPSIDAISVTPTELAEADTGMTDEFFTVRITISGFTEEIDVDATEVFYSSGSNDVSGIYQSATIAGDTITLNQIATSWFQGQSPGDYELGATVQSVEDDSGRPAEAVTEFGLATVTVTE